MSVNRKGPIPNAILELIEDTRRKPDGAVIITDRRDQPQLIAMTPQLFDLLVQRAGIPQPHLPGPGAVRPPRERKRPRPASGSYRQRHKKGRNR